MDEWFVFTMLLALFYGMGIMMGYQSSSSKNPYEPKPRNIDEIKHNAWIRGFKAGEESIMKRLSKRLKEEEIYTEMRENR